MCGIVGYVGSQNPVDYLLRGLRILEYRGYDSAGIAVSTADTLQVIKSPGRIDVLEKLIQKTEEFKSGTCNEAKRPDKIIGNSSGRSGGVPPTRPAPDNAYINTGIGHTRWATHGLPTQENAHPHTSFDGKVVIVHNGVIENYQSIRSTLQGKGIEFKTQTDTESIAHLIAFYLQEEQKGAEITAENAGEVLPRIVRLALSQLHGTYGLAVLFRDFPDFLIGAKLGSPLIFGIGNGENFLTSDASTLAGYTDRIITLSDHEIVFITANNYTMHHRDDGIVNRSIEVLDIDTTKVEKGGFAHYMLKEIFEQPETIRNAMRGHLDHDSATAKFGGLNIPPHQLLAMKRILITACGTSWHASLVGEYQIEMLSRIPVEVEYASELRYRNPPLDRDTLLFAITQSGETADTIAALREMKRRGYSTLAICNVIGSTISREADGGIYLHAGPEISVASTKTFSAQCTMLALLALHLGRTRHLNFEAGRKIIDDLERLPGLIEMALQTNDRVKKIAAKYAHCNDFLFLARQFNFPTALEGALKLKEISYIHAEGYAAGEMKHGPIALIDKNTPSVFIAPKSYVLDKTISNMQEIKARGGPVVALITEGDRDTPKLADDIIELPDVADFLQPIVFNIPLQLFAYHVAVARGCDVDKPRNLAKSVTVE